MAAAAGGCLLLAAPASASPGDLDPAFGPSGIQTVPGVADVRDFEIGADGDVTVLAGESSEYPRHPYLARIKPNGQLDPAFGGDGRVALPPSYSADAAIATQSDGAVVVYWVEMDSPGSDPSGKLIRYRADGTRDQGFGAGGSIEVEPYMIFLQVDPQDRILVDDDGFPARFSPSGRPDPSFDTAELQALLGPKNNTYYGVLQDGTSRLLLTTASSDKIVRLDEDGSLDHTFGEEGVIYPGVPLLSSVESAGDFVFAVGEDCYWFCSEARERYTSDGALDRTLPELPYDTIGHPTADGGLFALYSRSHISRLPRTAAVNRKRPGGKTDPNFGFNGTNVLYPGGQPLLRSLFGLDPSSNSLIVLGEQTDDGPLTIARISLGPGPDDADADGVLDANDHCVYRAGDLDGCPLLGALTKLRVSHAGKHKVSGKATATPSYCALRPPLKLVKVRRQGSDRVIRNAEIRERGPYFEITGRIPKRFYLLSPDGTAEGAGVCRGIQSDVVKRASDPRR